MTPRSSSALAILAWPTGVVWVFVGWFLTSGDDVWVTFGAIAAPGVILATATSGSPAFRKVGMSALLSTLVGIGLLVGLGLLFVATCSCID